MKNRSVVLNPYSKTIFFTFFEGSIADKRIETRKYLPMFWKRIMCKNVGYQKKMSYSFMGFKSNIIMIILQCDPVE